MIAVAECGPDQLSTERLAKEIGILQPTIFPHFPTKSEIWVAVSDLIRSLMGESSKLVQATNPTDRLRELVSAPLAFIETTPRCPRHPVFP